MHRAFATFRNRSWLAFAAAMLLGCTDSGSPRSASAFESPANPRDAKQVAQGRELYSTHCASCHGIELQGEAGWRQALPGGGYPAPPHDGSGHTWRHGDTQLLEAVKVGGAASAGPDQKSNMPGFEGLLSDGEIWAAIAYIKSHWPQELLARQALVSRTQRGSAPRADAGHAEHMGHDMGHASPES
jgi:mono/diheme cytochrome c family protein